ncbi:uncharacterized protein [Ptychodera flava]|uniref:uncharacterized protein n=1 Tax=Ptychodera flava TaxID=63121 RepID=UPI00396A53A5
MAAAVDVIYAPRSPNETSAVTTNQREDKMLEKRHQKLGIEKTYSVKLMEINERMLKIRFKKLKDRVSKIKSHLSHDEIAEINEEEFRSMASQRNQLNATDSQEDINGGGKESNKVSFNHERRAVTPGPTRKRLVNGRTSSAASYRPRPSTALAALPASKVRRPKSTPNSLTARRSLENGGNTGKSVSRASREREHLGVGSLTLPRFHSPATLLQPTSTAATSDQFGFDSHLFTDKTLASSANSEKQGRRYSSPVSTAASDMAISDTYARLIEEQRMMLIDENLILAAELEERKEEFLQKVDELVDRGRERDIKPFTPKIRADQTEQTTVKLEELRRKIREDKAHRLLHRFDRTAHFDLEKKEGESDEDYSKRISEYVKELRKCRYLRIPKAMEDYSGVVTLVREQTRVQGVWRKSLTHNLL